MIRDAESLEVLSISQCVEHIDRVEWSRDGDHVLCAQYRVGVVQCFSVSNDAWTCKIDEAAAGCVYARWTPCGTQIITVAEFNVRATAWSLVDRSCVVLDAPKLASADGFSFSPDGKFLAYARREACVDYVRVVSTKTWTTAADYRVATRCVHLTLVPIRPRRRGERRSLRTFPGASLRPGSLAFNPRPRRLSTPSDAFELHPDVASYGTTLSDCAGLAWSPDGTSIAVWDAPHRDSLVVSYAPDGTLKKKYADKNEGPLGVKSARWCPDGSGIAIGSFDRRCVVLNHVSFAPALDLRHADAVRLPTTAAVYKEVEEVVYDGAGAAGENGGGENDENDENDENGGENREKAAWPLWRGEGNPYDMEASAPDAKEAQLKALHKGEARVSARYVVQKLPAPVPTSRPGTRPKLGVGRTEWSHDGRFIATVDEKSPTAVWIWDAVDSGLAAVLLQMGDVTGVSWDPRGDRLAVVTGGERVYVWTPEGASFVQIPLPDFNAKDVAWSPTGGEMVLSDDKTFCCSFMQ